ncbi:MAG: hypothetical protein IPL37_08975 [Austwickia sp.]|nr:hypothetical protein [Austwickia sp.]
MPEPGWLEVMDEPAFSAALTTYAADNGISPEMVREQASEYLAEMFASHGERVTQSWTHFAQWMLRAHDVVVDEDNLVAVRRLDRSATLGFVFSHRSYLDGFVLPGAGHQALQPDVHLRRGKPRPAALRPGGWS